MFGPAQAAVARAVVDSVEGGVIPRDKVDDYCILVGVFIHWDAKDDKKIYDYNYQATKESIQRALANKPARQRSDLRLEDGQAPVQPQVERREGPAGRTPQDPRTWGPAQPDLTRLPVHA